MRHSLLALLLSSSLAAPLTAHSQTLYKMTFLPPDTTPHAIDASGRIVGVGADGRGFLWARGVITRLGTLGGNGSAAAAIGANAQVAGASEAKNGVSHVFMYQGGVLRDLGMLNGRPSFGTAINARGQVAGYALDRNGNDRAFVVSGGKMNAIGSLGSGVARATKINGAGTVAGMSFLRGFTAQHAFTYANGVMKDLGTLGGPTSTAAAINERGEVAGMSFVNDDVQHAFLYRDGVMHDLNDLVAKRGIWTVLDAVGINDAQQIAAYACTLYGECRAVLLEL